MTQSLPIIEQIAEVIASRLEEITEANGYRFDVAEVVRPLRGGFPETPKNWSCIVVQHENSYNETLSHAGSPPATAWDATFHIHCLVRESDKSDTPRQTRENEFYGAVIKAICNESNWHHMDFLAIVSDWGSVEPYISSTGDHAGITIPLIVTYRVSEDDPTEVRR